jgi:hypothetical protein
MDNELTISGTIVFPASGYLQGKIEWTAVGDPQNNRAIVTTNLYAHRTNNVSTTGRSWTGKVKVGDNTTHNFNGFSTEKSISNSYVLFATYTDVIDYEGSADKTVTISGQVKGPSGTSLANNTSSGSASVILPTLHKSPEVIISSVQELNTSLGIANDTFVQYLSQKRFTLQGIVYDDVSITDYSISNGTNTITSQSNIIDFDFRNIDLFVETNVLPIKASIKDSYNSVGSITQNYSNYILYQKPTIEPTSTTTKRNGQTSGRCLLNVAGNYWVGQIGSTTNNPVIKYRYWEKGTTEPSTWNTVPSASINTNNGRVTVTNYEIGTNDTTQSNYFDYQKAYNIRVQIEDNYYSDNTLKGITVGEAVWSEYKDRVDFIRATIKGEDISAIETGSNANGEYIKFSNGLLICRNIIEDDYTITTAWSNLYETSLNSTAGATTFPYPFISQPELVATQIANNVGGILGDITYDENGISRVNWRRPNSSSSTILQYSYIAIGFWK